MYKCQNQNCGKEYEHEERFCDECMEKGYHYCENCGKPIIKSTYSEKVGGLVCNNCK